LIYGHIFSDQLFPNFQASGLESDADGFHVYYRDLLHHLSGNLVLVLGELGGSIAKEPSQFVVYAFSIGEDAMRFPKLKDVRSEAGVAFVCLREKELLEYWNKSIRV